MYREGEGDREESEQMRTKKEGQLKRGKGLTKVRRGTQTLEFCSSFPPMVSCLWESFYRIYYTEWFFENRNKRVKENFNYFVSPGSASADFCQCILHSSLLYQLNTKDSNALKLTR